MNVDEAIDALLSVASIVFEPVADPKTNTRNLTEAIESLLHSKGLPIDKVMHDRLESPLCKVCVSHFKSLPRLTLVQSLLCSGCEYCE